MRCLMCRDEKPMRSEEIPMRLDEICAPVAKSSSELQQQVVFNAAHNPQQRSAGCVTLRKSQGNAVEKSGLPMTVRWVTTIGDFCCMLLTVRDIRANSKALIFWPYAEMFHAFSAGVRKSHGIN